MAENQTYIRQHVDDSEFDGSTLDMVRETLGKNKPQLLQSAAGEFMTAKERLDHLIGVLDKHLAELDKHWTGSDDSRVVKAQLRRLRESAHSVSTVINDRPPGTQQHPAKASGVAPALEQQGLTLAASRSDVPDTPDRDVSILEGAMQGAEGGGGVGAGVGAGVGFFAAGVGAIPGAAAGAVIGGLTGAVAGGVTAVFTDGPFANLFGDSKEEQDRKRAKEHIKKLSEATKANNDAFPASLRTDIPEFDMAPVDLPDTPFSRQGPTASGLPAGIHPPYDPSALSGPKLNGFGYPDVNTDGFNGDQIPGYDGTTPTGTLPDGSGIGNAGTGLNGTDLNNPDLNNPDSPHLNGADLADGSRTAQTGTGGNAPTTALAGAPDPTAANHANTAFATNAGYNGAGSGMSGAGGTGAGGGAGGAGIRGLGGNGMFGAPHGGGAGGGEDTQERERTTWLLEDEDVFSSDESTTSAFIRVETKKGRR
jgi:hypothetical protein